MQTGNTPARYSFTIKTAQDFFGKLEVEYADLQQNPVDSRHAINCAMTAWHLSDWIWADWLKRRPAIQQELFGRDFKAKNDFTKHLVSEGECPSLAIMQEITNGSKHFTTKGSEVASTDRRGTAFQPNFVQQNAFQVGTLMVRLTNKQDRVFLSVLEEVVEYWKQILVRR